MIIFFSILLVIVLLVCWMLTVVGLPGNWLMLLLVVIFAAFIPEDSNAAIGWGVLVTLGVLAVIGELIETLAGAMGATKLGGSKRSAVLSLVGSVVGGIFGLFVSLPIPIPVVAQLISAIFFASLGALLGAILGEQWKGKSLGKSLQVGAAAFVGRLLGTFAKMLIGSVMVVLAIIALFVQQL